MNKIAAVDLRFLFLAAMLVFLPGVEALKNIFAFLFVLSWVLISIKNNYWGGKWRIIDSIFLLWILGDIIVSINAIISHQLSGSNFTDIMRFVLILWVISRVDFSYQKITRLALISIIATIATLVYSYYSTGGVLKDLHSVGHINHTAIFLVIAYSISLSLLLFNFYNLQNSHKIITLIATIILFYATVDTGSRAAFGLLIIITLLEFTFLIIKYKKLSMFFLFVGVFFSVSIILVQNQPKFLDGISQIENFFQDPARERIRNFSYYLFKKNPFLGTGFGNFDQFKIEDIESIVIQDKGVFDRSKYLPNSHTHNVYLNYLVSGGLVMFSIFIWFWLYIVWIIFKLRPSKENEWIILSSISVLLINLVIGWVNTTLHHEQAILSMVVLGILISEYRRAENRRSLQTP